MEARPDKPKTIQEIIDYEAHERELNAAILEGDNVITRNLDMIDSTLRHKLRQIDIAEAAALRALDPTTATRDMVSEILKDFTSQRRALDLKFN